MKALLIGGTGTISSAVSRLLVEEGWDLFLLNRGSAPERVPRGATAWTADIHDEAEVSRLLFGHTFDAVANFIVRNPEDIARDYRLFAGNTQQYLMISTEAVYRRPPAYYRLREEVPMPNPRHAYACSKAACEAALVETVHRHSFPATIVRPAHTYDERNIPLDIVPGKMSTWTVLDRIRRGMPVLVAGDGNAPWTLTHSADFARAFVGLMGNAGAVGECVHIASEEVLTWNGIYDRIGTAMNCEVKKVHVASDFLANCWPELEGSLVLDKASGICFDTSKLQRLVPGFHAQIRFDQGVRQCLKYIFSHPEMQIADERLNRFYDRVIDVQQKALALFHQPE